MLLHANEANPGRGIGGTVDSTARLTSDDRVTIPKAVRDALGFEEGDSSLFRVAGDSAVLEKVPNFLSLAGSIPVSEAKRSAVWDEVLRAIRATRAAKCR